MTRPLVWITTTGLLTAGCYNTVMVRPDSLNALDGYERGAPRKGPAPVLYDASDRPFHYAGQTLVLETRDTPTAAVNSTETSGADDGTRVSSCVDVDAKFQHIGIRDGIFSGTTADGGIVRVALSDIEAAYIRSPDENAKRGVVWAVAHASLVGVAFVAFASSAEDEIVSLD
ncbi:hypothetical protein L6V77_29675 [Myxococcota bacterium]|nr:hypothetical protein [Myxococcota bacterium]